MEFAFATMPPIFTERKFKKERFLAIFRNFQTQNLQIPAKSSTFVPRFSSKDVSGRSAVRLAHLLWEQGVEGSNPFTPTTKRIDTTVGSFFIYTKRVPPPKQTTPAKKDNVMYYTVVSAQGYFLVNIILQFI